MRILHTSDWHLGSSLCGRKRYDEYDAFLSWMVGFVEEQQIEVLIIAGDVFDSTTPSNRAQEQYYRFLCGVSASRCCRHVVITAGNHDSPSFLDASRELLRFLDIHVVGSACLNPADEVLVLRDTNGAEELIVCAVPYLRDRDLRTSEDNESIEDKERKLVQGVARHYREVGECGEKIRTSLRKRIPMIALGHLFVAGGTTANGDGVRELYVGSLARIGADIFAEEFDYVALGHLHQPQKVGGSEMRRYCGAPLHMGFGEAGREKCVLTIDFREDSRTVVSHPVPIFQKIETIKGDFGTLSSKIRALVSEARPVWVEVVHDGSELMGNLRESLDELTCGSDVEVLSIRNNLVTGLTLVGSDGIPELERLSPEEVFHRCLDMHNVAEDQRSELLAAYREILRTVIESDKQAV